MPGFIKDAGHEVGEVAASDRITSSSCAVERGQLRNRSGLAPWDENEVAGQFVRLGSKGIRERILGNNRNLARDDDISSGVVGGGTESFDDGVMSGIILNSLRLS